VTTAGIPAGRLVSSARPARRPNFCGLISGRPTGNAVDLTRQFARGDVLEKRSLLRSARRQAALTSVF
jgi:hypothetical protein